MQRSIIAVLSILLVAVSVFAPTPSTSCTRVLWNDSGVPVLVGRTMDWPESTEPRLWVFPRGISRQGNVPDNPARWTAKYGSLVTSLYNLGSADGFNEKGLGMHMLYLRNTDFGPRDTSRPGLLAGLWGQYMLDNCATVKEALEQAEQLQPVLQEHRGFKATVHLALEDATGDSAILEYIEGKLTIHHGREYTVMTNDPSYDAQLELLKKLDFSHPSSNTPLPGNVKATDRFARATYFRNLLPKPKNEREAVAAMFAVVRNCSVPFGAPYSNDPKFPVYDTEYRTVSDLTHRVYYWEYSRSPSVMWVNLDVFKLEAGASPMTVDPTQLELNGDVSDKFEAAEKLPF